MKKIGVLLIGICICMVTLFGGCGKKTDDTVLRVGGMKGPTSMGLVFMQDKYEGFTGEKDTYQMEFTMVTQADELAAMVVRGEVDIALLPANLAAVLYQKTEGGITVIDINTWGVLYLVTGNEAWLSGDFQIQDLNGQTIYLTGMGTTPDYCLQTLLNTFNIEAKLEYKSESTEVLATLVNDPNGVALLPQPFVTSAIMQNPDLGVILDVDRVFSDAMGQRIVTGVTVVRDEFLEQHPDVVENFLQEHKESVDRINEDPEEGSKLVVKREILPKEAIAKAAIPNCKITFVQGEEMKGYLKAYLEILYKMDPKTVGGQLPDEDFYGK